MTPERSGPIDIGLADSNPLILSALSEVVDDDPRFSLVVTAKTARGFIEAVSRMPVDVGIVDWLLPDMTGEQTLERLRAITEPPRVVVYATGAEAELARSTLAAGAAGFCSRAKSPEELLDIAETVARGQMVFPFVDVRDLNRDPLNSLTKRERAMLTALARGRANAQLAEEFGVSINTIKFHLRNLYEKLDIGSRAEAIAFYYAATRGTQPAGFEEAGDQPAGRSATSM